MGERSCWARVLGDCSGQLCGEHIISRNQFDGSKTVTVNGMKSSRGESKTIGLSSFVSNRLCQGHNSALSPVDDEAKRFKNALRDFYETNEPTSVDIDARLVERWLLKTAINFALQHDEPSFEINEELVRVAFGLEAPRPGCGFFGVVRIGGTVGTHNGHIRHRSYASFSTHRVVLVDFDFHGTRLLYALDGAPMIDDAVRLRGFYNVAAPDDAIRIKWDPDFAPDDFRMRPALGNMQSYSLQSPSTPPGSDSPYVLDAHG